MKALDPGLAACFAERAGNELKTLTASGKDFIIVDLKDCASRGGLPTGQSSPVPLDTAFAIDATGLKCLGDQIAALDAHGHDATRHRARQFDPSWYPELDLVIAFDRGHEHILRQWASNDADRSKVQLLMCFDPDASGTMDVPDPYYSDAAMFDTVLLAIERACTSLFRQLEPAIRQGVP